MSSASRWGRDELRARLNVRDDLAARIVVAWCQNPDVQVNDISTPCAAVDLAEAIMYECDVRPISFGDL